MSLHGQKFFKRLFCNRMFYRITEKSGNQFLVVTFFLVQNQNAEIWWAFSIKFSYLLSVCHLLNILLIVFSNISAPCREILNFFVKSILFLLFSSVPVNHKHSASSKINQIETWHLTLKKATQTEFIICLFKKCKK